MRFAKILRTLNENVSRCFTKFPMRFTEFIINYLTILHVLSEIETVGGSGFMINRIALVSHSSVLVLTHLSFVFTRLYLSLTCL